MPHRTHTAYIACPALPCSPPPNSLQASDIEKGQLADSAAALSERCMGLEEQLKTARHSLLSLRAVADQGRGDLQAQLQRKESDMGRLQLAGEAQAALVDELKCQVDKHAQEREHLAMQAQQLSAQLAKAGEASKADNLRMAQLAAALEEKTLALAQTLARQASLAASDTESPPGSPRTGRTHASILQEKVQSFR